MKYPDPRCPKHGCLLEWCDGSWFCTMCSDEWDAEDEERDRLMNVVKDNRWLKQIDMFAEDK